MVFANRKDEVRRIEERLVRDGVNAAQCRTRYAAERAAKRIVHIAGHSRQRRRARERCNSHNFQDSLRHKRSLVFMRRREYNRRFERLL